MDDNWEISEGVLRGRKNTVGEWEFYLVFSSDENSSEALYPMDAKTAKEARRIASETEQKNHIRYKEKREYHHGQYSFNETSWTGEIIHKSAGKFLINELELDLALLTKEQKATLDRDILSIDSSYLTPAKQQAKKDLTTTRKVIKQIKKQKSKVESLSRGFRSTAYFSPLAEPDATIAQLLFELSENEKAICQTLDELGHGTANISAFQLCENAIDIFMRWSDKTVSIEKLGISYSPNFDTLRALTKAEGRPARFITPLGEFMEEIQFTLGKDGNSDWHFSVHEPSRKALRGYEKRKRYL